jgi:hypothetical protein
MTVPLVRWGIRFTANPLRRQQWVQDLYDDDTRTVKRGELFLNEVHEEVYYVGLDGIAKTVNGTGPIPFGRIDFTGLREFADDSAAAAASPAVPVGGMYRTGSLLKVRVA